MNGTLDGRTDAPPFGLPQPPQMVYISFGPAPHEEINAEIASRMLCLWKQRDPAHFGAVLAEAFTDVAPRKTRSR